MQQESILVRCVSPTVRTSIIQPPDASTRERGPQREQIWTGLQYSLSDVTSGWGGGPCAEWGWECSFTGGVGVPYRMGLGVVLYRRGWGQGLCTEGVLRWSGPVHHRHWSNGNTPTSNDIWWLLVRSKVSWVMIIWGPHNRYWRLVTTRYLSVLLHFLLFLFLGWKHECCTRKN